MAVLVTGVAGFIGMHCALQLLARGESVIGIDNLNDYYSVDLKRDRLRAIEAASSQFRFAACDIADHVMMSVSRWAGVQPKVLRVSVVSRT